MKEKREIKQVRKGPEGSIAQVKLDSGEKIPIEETIRQIKLGTVEGSYTENYQEGNILNKTANSYVNAKDKQVDPDYLEEALEEYDKK